MDGFGTNCYYGLRNFCINWIFARVPTFETSLVLIDLKKIVNEPLLLKIIPYNEKYLSTGHNNCGTRNSLSSREKKSEIHIKIGKPKLHPDPVIRWYCPLQIIGIGSEKVHGAFGSDSIRAIEMAFQMAGLLLVRDIQKLYNLNWLKPEHLYFPPPNNLEELSKNEIHLQKKLKKHNIQIQYKSKFLEPLIG